MDAEQRIDRLTEELRLTPDEETKAAALRYAEELQKYVNGWDEERRDRHSRGHWGGDEYNALLDVYDEPRQRRSEGVLSGLSFVVKDNMAVEGLRMTCGAASFETVPAVDATVVDRLLEAGGSLLGKANMDAFAFGPGGLWSERGRVRNPIDKERIPGGTSSGCGVAVAAGLVDAALGSDTGGSVRSPAACCGVVGIKPTHGLVSRYGFVGNVPSADAIGPLARDVETAARVLEAIRGPDVRDPTTSAVDVPPLDRDIDAVDSLRVGVLELARHGVSDTVIEAIDGLAADLEAEPGVSIESIDLDMEAIEEAYSVISGAEFVWLLRQSFAQRGGVPTYPDMVTRVDGDCSPTTSPGESSPARISMPSRTGVPTRSPNSRSSHSSAPSPSASSDSTCCSRRRCGRCRRDPTNCGTPRAASNTPLPSSSVSHRFRRCQFRSPNATGSP